MIHAFPYRIAPPFSFRRQPSRSVLALQRTPETNQLRTSDLFKWTFIGVFRQGFAQRPFLLNADFHITSRTSFYSPTDLCFTSDPRAVGELLTVATS
jgi:hypothetical protein